MKSRVFFAVLLALPAVSWVPAIAAAAQNECDKAQCVAGSAVAVRTVKGERFFVCPTLALADYTNFVLGIAAMAQTLGGAMPDISPHTGEPVQDGASKVLLDAKRQHAKVKTFDQAAAACRVGKSAAHMTVMNNGDPLYIWVGNGTINYWAPKFSVHLASS